MSAEASLLLSAVYFALRVEGILCLAQEQPFFDQMCVAPSDEEQNCCQRLLWL